MATSRSHHRANWGLRTLIIGAGEAGRSVARDLRRSRSFGLQPIGFVDDDLHKRFILVGGMGLRVLGPISSLERIAKRERAEAAVVAIPSLPAARVRAIGEAASAAGLWVRYLPTFLSALERDARAGDLRTLPLPALLGREELHVLRPAARTLIEGRRVLVTGAGGSIGSELCRQVRSFKPSALYMLDHDESNLHSLQLELDGNGLLDSSDIIIADIRDRSRIDDVFSTVRPELVLHAAAHKHLPLLERHPCEGVKTNVLGTHNLIDAALGNGVERFLLISTDKAADPTSVLGATKRLAEMLVHSSAVGTTALGSVRFGNVLGSRGSFLTVLREQVARGEPVTVTDPEVTRFFMTVEEAVGLVLEAASMAEFGETFVLDMGEPVRIVDLVRNYAELLHLDGVEITFSGLRAGEKLNESVFAAGEERTPTANPKIWAIAPSEVSEGFRENLPLLYEAAARNNKETVYELMRLLVAGYAPSCVIRADDLAVPYPDGF